MDKYKEAKDFLMRVRRLEGRIEQLEEIKRQAWEAETAITGNYGARIYRKNAAGESETVGYAPVPRGGGDNRKGESYAVLTDQCAREIIRLNHIKAETLAVISQIEDNTLARLLTSYYVMGKTWEQTAVDMSYSWRHIMNLHGRALEAVEEMLERRT